MGTMISQIMPWAMVGAGGALGAMARHAVNHVSLNVGWMNFPWATMSVNIIGAFLMGMVTGIFALHGETGHTWRLFLAVGVLGGFTTFSAFSLDAVLLLQKGQWVEAAFYIGGSVLFSLAALVAGLILLRMMLL